MPPRCPAQELNSCMFGLTKVHRWGSLDNKSLFSHCPGGWTSIYSQVVQSFGFFQGLSPGPAHGCLLAVSSHGPFPWCAHPQMPRVSVFSVLFSYKDTCQVRLGLILTASSKPSHLSKGLTSKCSSILRCWVLEFQHEFGGQNSAHDVMVLPITEI